MKKILFVEDDALIASTYGQRLADEGFEVAVAADGLAAMRGLPDFKPDLVVLDLLMPKMSGIDVLKFMRLRPDLAAVQVIIFSNMFVSGDLVEQIEALRVEKVLPKASVTPGGLVEAIHSVLAGAAAASPASPYLAPPVARLEPKMSAAAAATSAVPIQQPAPARAKESATAFQTRVQRDFLERIPIIFKGIRQICRDFVEAADSAGEAERLEDLSRKIGFLTQMTGTAGYHRIAELCSALEALLFELLEKPALINDSCRNTITSTVAFLADCLDRVEAVDEQNVAASKVMVVDDDAVSNRAVVLALGRAKLATTSESDPFEALKRLEQTSYDLLLLDVRMPGMDGLTLCEQIRELPRHRRTPIVFVTSLTDFKTRARAMLIGGNDVITKPILPVELCVKVLTHLLKAH